jgi:hypothetical protein
LKFGNYAQKLYTLKRRLMHWELDLLKQFPKGKSLNIARINIVSNILTTFHVKMLLTMLILAMFRDFPFGNCFKRSNSQCISLLFKV